MKVPKVKYQWYKDVFGKWKRVELSYSKNRHNKLPDREKFISNGLWKARIRKGY